MDASSVGENKLGRDELGSMHLARMESHGGRLRSGGSEQKDASVVDRERGAAESGHVFAQQSARCQIGQ